MGSRGKQTTPLKQARCSRRRRPGRLQSVEEEVAAERQEHDSTWGKITARAEEDATARSEYDTERAKHETDWAEHAIATQIHASVAEIHATDTRRREADAEAMASDRESGWRGRVPGGHRPPAALGAPRHHHSDRELSVPRFGGNLPPSFGQASRKPKGGSQAHAKRRASGPFHPDFLASFRLRACLEMGEDGIWPVTVGGHPGRSGCLRGTMPGLDGRFRRSLPAAARMAVRRERDTPFPYAF